METIISKGSAFLASGTGQAAAGLVLLILAVLIVLLYRAGIRRRFRRRLRRALSTPAELSNLRLLYSENFLRRQTPLVEHMARRENPEIIPLLGYDDLWVQAVRDHKREADIRRVLEFCPDKGLFACFQAALKKPSAAAQIKGYLKSSGDFLALRRIPLSAPGETFDTAKAYQLLEEHLSQLREMTGDPEWAARYFAVSILLEDPDERTARTLWDAVSDSHPLIRRTVISRIPVPDPMNTNITVAAADGGETADTDSNGESSVSGTGAQLLYETLFEQLKRDPVFEVRREARERIRRDFSDAYQVKTEELKEEEALHILELLDPSSEEDENSALDYLKGDNLEHRFIAAQFLAKKGTLTRLFLEADIGDKEILERNYTLLSHSCSVSIDTFLNQLDRSSNPGTLLIAARLLPDYGNRELITILAQKTMDLVTESNRQKDYLEIYNKALVCIVARGTDKALAVLRDELNRRPEDEEFLEMLLPALPSRGDALFLETLISFLKNPEFPAREVLEQTLASFPDSLILPAILEIIQSGRDKYSHQVRISALKILGQMEHPYCLQTILENLPTLPLEEARHFAKLLQEYDAEHFETRAASLLNADDAHVRASLIAALPATGKKSFLKEIKEGLEDADPEVRIASLWALLDYNEIRNLPRLKEMLRDPVQRVRVEAGRALGLQGTAKTLESLAEALNDPNEVQPVKEAVLAGLAASEEKSSLGILTDFLEKTQEEDPLKEAASAALAEKQNKNFLEGLIETFKDAAPEMRERLSRVFAAMGETGEAGMVGLLRQDIPSLRPFIAEVLEGTGYVEAMIRRLAHRDAAVRREAAEVLSLMNTAAAFRGIVMAARDPDQEVRIQVTKALDRLDSEEGKTVLEQLEQDPDKKIRKYTHWALERHRARKL